MKKSTKVIVAIGATALVGTTGVVLYNKYNKKKSKSGDSREEYHDGLRRRYLGSSSTTTTVKDKKTQTQPQTEEKDEAEPENFVQELYLDFRKRDDIDNEEITFSRDGSEYIHVLQSNDGKYMDVMLEIPPYTKGTKWSGYNIIDFIKSYKDAMTSANNDYLGMAPDPKTSIDGWIAFVDKTRQKEEGETVAEFERFRKEHFSPFGDPERGHDGQVRFFEKGCKNLDKLSEIYDEDLDYDLKDIKLFFTIRYRIGDMALNLKNASDLIRKLYITTIDDVEGRHPFCFDGIIFHGRDEEGDFDLSCYLDVEETDGKKVLVTKRLVY